MTITRSGSTTAITSNGWATTSTGIQLPGALGDCLLLHWAGGGSAAPTTDPTTLGWALVQDGTSANVRAMVWSKIATSGDPGSFMFNEPQTSQRIAATCVAYTGVDTTAPVAVSSKALESATAATHDASALTTTGSGLLVRFLGLRDAGTKSTTRTAPADVTKFSDVETGNTTFGVVSAVGDSGTAVAAGSYTGNWTVDQSTNAAVGIALSLTPAAGSATAPATRWVLNASHVWVAHVTDIIT